MNIDVHIPVGKLVSDRPSRALVFARFGIDFCCGGARTLDEQCREKSLDPKSVLLALEAHDSRSTEPEIDWRAKLPSALISHILSKHHQYLRDVLPPLSHMTVKVAASHGEKKPEYREIPAVFEAMYAELDGHMRKEEKILFPAIIQWEQSGMPKGGGKPLGGPIRVMLMEHDSASQALTKLRELTDDFTPYHGACNTTRAMMAGLAELETDLHMHIHLENNILFPRVLESDVPGAAALNP